MPQPPVSDRLSTVHYDLDDRPHIVVDAEQCRGCQAHPCLDFCPAGCFTPRAEGGIDYYHLGCLECGACLLLCRRDAVEWNYPRGGYGISYRY